ncbi:hypothetical protein AB0G74_17385 [Streptomyces sp. NPDC020875]|uniref:hypothetical protein n=1 Tax=Streptomyces sp. NPDC020875 TaxID=3154898 RepID=UPI0033DF869A
MTHDPGWDLVGTLGGGPSLFDDIRAEAVRLLGRTDPDPAPYPPRRTPPPEAPAHSRRAALAPDEPERIAAVVARLTATGGPPDPTVLAHLDRRVRRLGRIGADHPVLTAIGRRALPRDRLAALARWSATRGEHLNAVRFGLLLAARHGGCGPYVLRRLGVIGDFTDAAIVAVRALPRDPESLLLHMAAEAEGWARVGLVRALRGSADPRVEEWLIRESCTGGVLDSYFCLIAAETGDLAGALDRDEIDDELLRGAGRLLAALTDVDGPGTSIGSYEDGPRALIRYLHHATARPPSTEWLLGLAGINRFLTRPSGAVERWGGRIRMLRAAYAKTLYAPGTPALIEAAWHGTDPAEIRRAAWLARLLGLPYRAGLLKAMPSAPLESGLWYLLVDDCPDDEAQTVFETAERLLPLADLRSPPADCLGFGAGHEADQCLDMVVSRLDRHPGLGRALLVTALRNHTSRNRRMAVRALQAWPVERWPPAVVDVLRAAHAEEGVDDLREKLAGLLRAEIAGLPDPAVRGS